MATQNNISINQLLCESETDKKQNVRLDNLEISDLTQNNKLSSLQSQHNDLSNNISTKKLFVNREVVENLDIIPSQ